MFRRLKLLLFVVLAAASLLLASGVVRFAHTQPDGSVAFRPRVDLTAARWYLTRALAAAGLSDERPVQSASRR